MLTFQCIYFSECPNSCHWSTTVCDFLTICPVKLSIWMRQKLKSWSKNLFLFFLNYNWIETDKSPGHILYFEDSKISNNWSTTCQLKTAFPRENLWLSIWSLSCRCFCIQCCWNLSIAIFFISVVLVIFAKRNLMWEWTVKSSKTSCGDIL